MGVPVGWVALFHEVTQEPRFCYPIGLITSASRFQREDKAKSGHTYPLKPV